MEPAKNDEKLVVIGSRGSPLAMMQANWVKDHLQFFRPELDFRIKEIATSGDRITDVALAKIGGKGLFTKEIESELSSGIIDIAVHSMKDVPTALPEGLKIGAVPLREDPRDALVSRNNINLSALPAGNR